jgi:hypothetical protein
MLLVVRLPSQGTREQMLMKLKNDVDRIITMPDQRLSPTEARIRLQMSAC